MKRSIHIAYLLIYLISFQLQALGQILPPSCGGNKVRYGVSGLPNSIFQWEITGGNIDRNYNDSIDVSWNTGVTEGVITVTEHTVFGCVASPSVSNIAINNIPSLSLDKQLSICEGKTTDIIPLGNFDSYQWNNGSTDKSISVSKEGWYKLTASKNGCSTIDSTYLTVVLAPKVYLGRDTTLCNSDLTLYAGNDGTSYLWSTGERTNTIMVSNINQGQRFWVEVENDFGCKSQDTIRIHSCGKIPNTITPNGDGDNDTWVYEKFMASNVDIQIFDRWGRKVFQSKNGLPPGGWDGTSNGRELPMDSYYYIINLNDGTGTVKGTITIIR